MDWQNILRDLGGEIGVLPAVVIGGLAYACWHLMRRVATLQEQRVADTKEVLSDAGRREVETITALNLVNATMNALVVQLGRGDSK